MAVDTIQITGLVLLPDATPAQGGDLGIRLVQKNATVDDAGTEQVVAPSSSAIIETDGSVDFELISTDDISVLSGAPLYRVRYRTGRNDWIEFWSLPNSLGDPVDIGDIPRISPDPDTPGLLQIPINGAIGGGDTTQDKDRGLFYLIPGAAGDEDLLVCGLKGYDDVVRFKIVATGGGP